MTRPMQRRPANENHPRLRLNAGDEAAPGTPGTGEDICPECRGKGRINGAPCRNCGGSGKIVRAIGGA